MMLIPKALLVIVISCVDVDVAGHILSAMCRTRNGKYRATSIPIIRGSNNIQKY